MKNNDIPYGVGVLVVRDGKFLCGNRTDTNEIGGPGGYIKKGETPENAAIRKTKDEFGIIPKRLIPIGCLKSRSKRYQPCKVFVCTEFAGTPRRNSDEMTNACFMDVRDIDKLDSVYPAFDDSLNLLIDHIHCDGGPGSGNFGHSGRPGLRGGSSRTATMSNTGHTAEGETADIHKSTFVEDVTYTFNSATGMWEARAQDPIVGNDRTYAEGMTREEVEQGIAQLEADYKHRYARNAVLYGDDAELVTKVDMHCEITGVEYIDIKPLGEPLGDEGIIDKLTTGNNGSCASLVLAFAANKLDLDVTDSRGGESEGIFSQALYDLMVQAGAQTTGKDSKQDARALLSYMEDGKEYIFTCGLHAAITRNYHGQIQYCEMQGNDAAHNGWKSFDDMTLSERFGHFSDIPDTYYPNTITEINQLNGNKTFEHLLGYINTNV